ncbi:uncharacterized protein LOC119604697 [Lucilia sericata]|uniref:uncharacterized protein LOC119604697 n=1 Tax=Lucilia sericata TaxID=13632 RepID=UPI0018A86740|nr:uncharacterized protein LOC119604697 [Lucilia sericata]
MLFKKILLINLLVILTLLTAIQAVEKEDNLLSATLRVIFANIFKPKSMSISVIVNISNHEDFTFSQDILDDLMSINKNIQLPVTINQYTASKLLHFIQAKLIFTNSAENVRKRMEYLFQNNEIQSLSTKYLIILNNQDSLHKKLIEMHNIFQDFFNLYIVDVVILLPEADSLCIYTYKPYDLKHCAFTEPILLQCYLKVPDILSYNDLFPIKTNNFYQCPLKVVLWHTPPFVNITYRKGIAYYTGFDVEILKDLSDFLNFSIEVIPNEPPELLSGEVFSNYTAIGVFKLLLERRANLSIGFIGCKPRRSQLTTGSMPYFLTEILIIFKNYQKYTEYYLLFRPFTNSTWGVFIIVLILKPIFKRILCRNFKLQLSFRNLLRLQWVFMIFLLRLAYEGSIFETIRKSPYKPLPLNLNELVQQNYSLITDYATARMLKEITILENITTIVPGNPSSILELIDDLPPNTGVLSWDTIVAQFMKTRLRNYNDYAIVRDKVSNGMCCIFFPRLSFMAPSVDLLLNQYKMFGIFNKYMKQLGFEYLPTTTDQLRTRFSWNSKAPLDLSILVAVFRCFAVMNIAAMLNNITS